MSLKMSSLKFVLIYVIEDVVSQVLIYVFEDVVSQVSLDLCV